MNMHVISLLIVTAIGALLIRRVNCKSPCQRKILEGHQRHCSSPTYRRPGSNINSSVSHALLNVMEVLSFKCAVFENFHSFVKGSRHIVAVSKASFCVYDHNHNHNHAI